MFGKINSLVTLLVTLNVAIDERNALVAKCDGMRTPDGVDAELALREFDKTIRMNVATTGARLRAEEIRASRELARLLSQMERRETSQRLRFLAADQNNRILEKLARAA